MKETQWSRRSIKVLGSTTHYQRTFYRWVSARQCRSHSVVLNHFELPPVSSYSLSLDTSTACNHGHHLQSNNHPRRKFCSCGKCTLVAQFQQACPLAHSVALTPHSKLYYVTASYYTIIISNSTLSLIHSGA